MTNAHDTQGFDPQANRNHKDGLFRKLFSDKEGALELYNALNGSSYNDPELLEITTIENILKPFLLKHRGEVGQMILTEYNAALHIRSEKQLSYEEGELHGIQIGEQRGIQIGAQKKTLEITRSLLNNGASPEYIREILKVSSEEWNAIVQKLEKG